MVFIKRPVFIIFLFWFGSLFLGPTDAKALPGGPLAISENSSMIGNGQGVSTPSYWQGLNGHNPAGLAINSTLKVQGTGAAFDSDLSPARASGAVLGGNGTIGAGVEWSQYRRSPLPFGESNLNWGVGVRLSPVHSMIGISGRHNIPGNTAVYTAGLLFDVTRSVRFGLVVEDFTESFNAFSVGLNGQLTSYLEWIVDAGTNRSTNTSIVKPGFKVHVGNLNLSTAYGFRMEGRAAITMTPEWTTAIGFQITSFTAIQYEYQGLTEHRVGLTLKWN